MIVRIFYTSERPLSENMPPTGTKYDVSTAEDLIKLIDVFRSEIILTKKRPTFIDHYLNGYYNESNFKRHYLTEMPDPTWKNDVWIEIYDDYRE